MNAPSGSTPAPPGTIITFYSYKGGTGRSMSLANVAWILASNGHKVLVIDWDLEAPGLHRYFAPFLDDKSLAHSEGLIEFVEEYRTKAMSPMDPAEQSSAAPWYFEQANILRYTRTLDAEFPDGGRLDFVPAGRQDPTYPKRVNTFDWQSFFTKLGGQSFFEAAKEHMRNHYRYVLIDSRTGVSDTSGICTIQMPDVVALHFTLNNQSIEGAFRVAQSVQEQRKATGVKIFPVPTRVDPFEQEKLDVRWKLAKERLSPFLTGMSTPDEQDRYWDAVHVPYKPFYAYEEILATFGDAGTGRREILKPAERLAAHLVGNPDLRFHSPPEEVRQLILARFAGGDDPLQRTEKTLLTLSADEQQSVRSLLGRLVLIQRADGGARYSRASVAVAELPPLAARLVDFLSKEKIIQSRTDSVTQGQTLTLASDTLLSARSRLRAWLEQDVEFLLWRQDMAALMREWLKEGRSDARLLRGPLLGVAPQFLRTRAVELNEVETQYLERSTKKQTEVQAILKSTPPPTAVPPPAPLLTALPAPEPSKPLRPDDRPRLVTALAAIFVVLGIASFSYTRLKQANSATEARRFQEATNLLAEALQAYPTNQDYGITLAYESFQKKNIPRTEETLRRFLGIPPGDPLTKVTEAAAKRAADYRRSTSFNLKSGASTNEALKAVEKLRQALGASPTNTAEDLLRKVEQIQAPPYQKK